MNKLEIALVSGAGAYRHAVSLILAARGAHLSTSSLGIRAAFEKAVASGRFASPQEVAAVTAHLSFPRVPTPTAAQLVDGGSSAGHLIGQE